MIRYHYLQNIADELRVHPACAIIGPRQVGKTTLALQFADMYYEHDYHVFDLEDPYDVERLSNPVQAFSVVKERLIIIDEVQRRPDLYSLLRVIIDKERGLADRKRERKRSYLILGSASPKLLKQSSETLTGRLGIVELSPFSLFEVKDMWRLWTRGGFPESYYAFDEADSFQWRSAYIRMFLEQDIPHLGFDVSPTKLRTFWAMIAFYHGNILAASEIGRSLGISHHKVKNYLDILCDTLMIRKLMPHYENSMKRQVKSPKIYFRDMGLLNALLDKKTAIDIQRSPQLGSFWEGFALEEILKYFQIPSDACFFWATHAGAELDLMIIKNGKRYGFEMKYSGAPKISKSMTIALNDLKLERLIIVFPDDKIFSLSDKVIACGLSLLSSGELDNIF